MKLLPFITLALTLAPGGAEPPPAAATRLSLRDEADPALRAAPAGGMVSTGPYVNGQFRGRIAYSCDGNHNDPDDWISSAVALAIFAQAGLKDRLVHCDYNCILPLNDPEWERTHADSVLGAVERYGYDRARFHDCRKELDRAVASIARAINDSSAENPLYYILAGPMEVPFLGIQKADPAKRKFVYCISHSIWNDGYSTRYKYTHTKRSVIEQDIHWVQVRGQQRLSTSPYGRAALPEEWQPFHWMRDSKDARLRWLWDRMLLSTRPDCSDAGMAWFVVTGDESADPAKLKALLDGHERLPVAAARNQVRLEAENFRHLDGCAVEYRNDRRASHALQVALTADAGRLRTRFDQPYARTEGRYDVDVRFLDEAGSRSRFTLLVNGVAQGEAWESAGQGGGWTTQTVRAVPIRVGDEIAVEVKGRPARLDYVELNATAASGAAAAQPAPGRLRVAVVQMALRPTLAENRDRIITGIGQAADRAAGVAVFPERALTGTGSERQDLVDEAVDAIRRAVRARRIHVVFGAHTWLPSIKKTGNWMLALDPDGRELLRYEKLYNNHHATMPGVFMVDGVACGTAICADRWLRGVVELPIQQGAQVHFELSNNYACEWVAPYEWYWNAPLARRNTVWCVLANSANQVSGVAAAPDHLKHGHSAILAPDGRLVAGAHGDTEDLLVADIDPAEATRAGARARATHPALRPFWEAGLKLHRGETLDAVSFQPLPSAATEITLAAAPVAGNLAQMEAMIREARARKADLIAFPAQAIPETALEPLRAAARANQITVVFGTKYRDAAGWHSSAFVLGPDGAVLTRYDQLSATAPFERGTDARAMWFHVKGVPAVVTLERDALWTELAELAAVAGAQVHIHLDHEAGDSPADRLRRLQTWANFASFLTFTATVTVPEAMIWDDLRGRDESRAVVRGTPKPDSGVVEVDSPFSANLVARATRGELVVATRRVSAANPYHPSRTSNLNPQMRPWYELGAQLIRPR
jgi:predicted amidohydrolase